ncbi:MAG TPA: DUF5565 family protein [Terriglobales bacterium]|jgi:hypothetical protein|nr:DUF5565 family protein [Terriglobales bacterium]
MRKIPTIFVRDLSKQPALVIPEWVPGCEWVRDGEGVPTRKWDGTSVMIRAGKMYKRRELRDGEPAPAYFERVGTDDNTGKTVGWVPVGDGPDDKYHREANCTNPPDGTYELVGPKINGNRDKFPDHRLVEHGDAELAYVPRQFDSLKAWLETQNIEGVVWHHPDGRMAKIKRRDFGLKW